MLSFLPEKLKSTINKLGLECVSEIRIRNLSHVLVVKDGNKCFLEKFILNKKDIEDIILNVCKRSIYSFEGQIKQGFITTDKGVRIGLSGELVYKNEEIASIKNFQSLTIRIPHDCDGVSKEFSSFVYKGGSVLVISPPSVGKTTFLRDFTRYLSNKLLKNVAVVDERNEIACVTGEKSFFLGDMTDVLTYSTKNYGLNQAIRTLNPDVIVLDELVSLADVNSVVTTINGGVDVVATVHAKSIKQLFMRDFTSNLKKLKVFDYYVVINFLDGKRRYDYFDKDFNQLCLQ